ncbi:PGR5-like protein 1A, chloroplastic [Cucurbita pepo subsp. pepo]|uniref:PGR5-like protein 1A, chloroplastic n=1 Tax=Cucurbita pepo subsp. pepo TaxID=3664 RepID=UPI000C9D5353|nr:PGR5-like protein 1A, chloroplastic [Cucurbita pepo subsp. pepo]
MAATRTSFFRHLTKPTVSELTRTIRSAHPFHLVRFSARTANNALSSSDELVQGPSCIFVGPIETASKETLEALYLQARDAYYSGQPLIVDDMFDRVELKLRWFGSKSVVKYPRCSLRRQSTYADAEEDLSQVLALAGIWSVFLALGCSACLVPLICTADLVFKDPLSLGLSYNSQGSAFEFLSAINAILFIAFGSLIGYPIATASVGVLQGLWRNDLVALKGACPNCGEEVFAFVRSDRANGSPHRSDCHVCECLLEFRIKFEKSSSRQGRQWVYGRIYFVRGKRRRQR